MTTLDKERTRQINRLIAMSTPEEWRRIWIARAEGRELRNRVKMLRGWKR